MRCMSEAADKASIDVIVRIVGCNHCGWPHAGPVQVASPNKAVRWVWICNKCSIIGGRPFMEFYDPAAKVEDILVHE